MFSNKQLCYLSQCPSLLYQILAHFEMFQIFLNVNFFHPIIRFQLLCLRKTQIDKKVLATFCPINISDTNNEQCICGTLICQHLITLITLPTSVSFCQMYRCWQIYCRIANIYTYHLYLLLSDPTLYIKCNSISKLLTEV